LAPPARAVLADLPFAIAAHLHPGAVHQQVEVAACAAEGDLDADRSTGLRGPTGATVLSRSVVGTGWRSPAPASPPVRPSSAGSPPFPLASGLEPVAPPGSICRKARPNRILMPRQNWMAASEYVSDRPGRPLGLASHSISRSSQTNKEPRRRSAAV
jgi:hypothetical protein